jgi:hypothetical protein
MEILLEGLGVAAVILAVFGGIGLLAWLIDRGGR